MARRAKPKARRAPTVLGVKLTTKDLFSGGFYKPSDRERLRHPEQFTSLAAWVRAAERTFGRDRADWPQWARALLVRETAKSIRGRG